MYTTDACDCFGSTVKHCELGGSAGRVMSVKPGLRLQSKLLRAVSVLPQQPAVEA